MRCGWKGEVVVGWKQMLSHEFTGRSMFYQLERSLRVRGLNEVPREAL